MERNDKINEERNDVFDSAMREKLSGHEPAVPHALWSRISAELNETEVAQPIAATAIPMYQPATSAAPKWKTAIAAAVIVTLGLGSLLFVQNDKNGSATAATSAPAAVAPAIAVPAAMVNKSVAEIAQPSVTKQTTAPVSKYKAINTVIAATVADDKAPENVTEPAVDTENQMASAPATNDGNVEVPNIPIYSLKKLSPPVMLDDEITIIKSAPAKKKHHKQADEETTRVIVINKKYSSQPDIRYQIPVRF